MKNTHEIACRNFWNGDIYALDRYHAENAAATTETDETESLTFDEIVALLNA